MAEGFVHLHLHTHYSLLDGAVRISDLMQACKDAQMPAVAITDHGNMFGVIEFYQEAVKAGVKPIIGIEAYVAPGDRRDKDARGLSEAAYHLVLLAKDLAGYKNLLKLASLGYLEGFYYRPRIDKQLLRQYNGGLICLSSCLAGEIPQAILSGDEDRAGAAVEEFLDIFGEERFFLELQNHGLEEQEIVNEALIDLARRVGVGLVATNDVHYLRHEDAEAHEILCCIATGKRLEDADRLRFGSDQYYLKSPDEMRELFGEVPEALDNTLRIAEQCNLELDFSKRYTPVFKPPDGQSEDEYLRRLVYEGAKRRYGEITDEIRQRIDYELEVISSKGFSGYFLIVHDFVQYARSRGIPCSARGSGCSAVVSYCLGISEPDPLRYGLYFERFMDPDRDEMPDIDVDMCQYGRAEVIDYVRRKYGHVAQIITFGTLKPRAAIRDVCRVLGVPLAEAERIAKMVPEAVKMTVDRALEEEPDLRAEYESNPTARRVIDIARKLEGLARHASVHAAGVVIADRPLDEFLPLYKPPDSDQIITQFQGTDVEKIGLLKMDFLGLRTLTTLEHARRLVKKYHDVDIDLESLDLTDQKVYDLFARGETKGIFQFESGGMRDVLMKMRPNRIEDLIAANALYRPGPMVNIDAYIARKHGEPWNTPHPVMTEVLEETYGIMVYQEQVSRLVHRLGGIELKRAFRLAKAISKKKTELIEAEREPFIKGAMRNGLDRRVAEQIFEDILRFGGYAFNKAHSTRYALVAFQTAYMKVYWPVEFMAALLTFERHSPAKVAEYIEECRRMGIPVMPPDVNSSDLDFTPVYPAGGQGKPCIRFGLSAIKGVGDKAVQEILRARSEGGPFRSIFDFCERVDLTVVNRSVIEALIKAGAFDSTGAMRKALIDVLDKAIEIGQAAQHDRQAGQLTLLETFDSQMGQERAEPEIPASEWTEAEMLAYEKEVLGFYVTRHPLSQHSDVVERFSSASTATLREYPDGAEVVVGGLITNVRTVLTRSGKNAGSKMAIVRLEDLEGQIDAIIFSDLFRQHAEDLRQDRIVFLRGRVDRRREEPSIRVSEVIPLEGVVERLAAGILIRISCIGRAEETLEQVREVLKAHPGSRPVYLELATPDGLLVLVRCSQRLCVRPNQQLLDDLGRIVGREGLVVLGLQNRRTNGRQPQRTALQHPAGGDEQAIAALETEEQEREA